MICHHVFFPAVPPVPQAPGSISSPKCNHSCVCCGCCYTVDSLAAVVGVCVHHGISIPPPHLAATGNESQCYTPLQSHLITTWGAMQSAGICGNGEEGMLMYLKHTSVSFLLCTDLVQMLQKESQGLYWEYSEERLVHG